MQPPPPPAGIRGILTGASAWWSRAAQFVRGILGIGVATGVEPQPYRPRATTVQEAVADAIAAGVQPETASNLRFSDRYICIFTDPQTGEVLARIPLEVEYDQGTPASTIYSRARRQTARMLSQPSYARYLYVDPASMQYRLPPNQTCRRVSRKQVPTIP